MQRDDDELTKRKLRYLKDNIENLQFIAAHELHGNEHFEQLIHVLQRDKPTSDHLVATAEYILRTYDSTQQDKSPGMVGKLLKKSKSSKESSGEEQAERHHARANSKGLIGALKEIRHSISTAEIDTSVRPKKMNSRHGELKQSRSSGETESPKPRRPSNGLGSFMGRKSQELPRSDVSVRAIGELKSLSRLIIDDLRNHNISFDDFVDKIDPVLSQLSTATGDELRDWARRPK